MDYQYTLNRILQNNQKINKEQVKNILIVYDDSEFYLGDTCINFHRFSICKAFFGNDTIVDLNCLLEKYSHIYDAFSVSNPSFDHVFCKQYDHISFEKYDLIFCISYNEEPLLKALHHKRAIDVAVFSFSELLLFARNEFRIVFPVYRELLEYSQEFRKEPNLLPVTDQERLWGNQWLEAKGLKKNERLVVLLDSSGGREKLLKLDVYYNILLFFLQQEHTRILIFDEKGIGKEDFYREWLGVQAMKKIIFSKKLSLRQDLCILSADYISLVLGPCTGLLHCVSSINNYFIKEGRSPANVPVMIVYTGPWDIQFWWANAPLVKCLILKKESDQKKIYELKQLGQVSKEDYTRHLSCSEYTAPLLIDFINEQL